LVFADNTNPNNIQDPKKEIFFDTEGDDADNILAISSYKISVIDKKSFLYFNTISKETIDLNIDYDYSNDKFYFNGSESSEGTIFRTFNSYITTGLADY